MSWIPLHVHSQYSVLDALPSTKQLATKAAEYGMPALALTDHGNLFGAVEFFKDCKDKQVKPIIGCEVYIAPESRFDKTKLKGNKAAFHLTLLAKNNIGYHNLCRLSSIGYLEGYYYHPRIDKEVLSQYKEGIICLSGCMNSPLSYLALLENKEEFWAELDWYIHTFGEDFYLELQRHTMSEENLHNYGFYQETWRYQEYESIGNRRERINQFLVEASTQKGLKYVATNDSHYIRRDDCLAHEILLNVQSGEPCEIWEKDSMGNPKFRVPNPKRRTYPSTEYYFKSPEEMRVLFSDLSAAIDTTLEVADKCYIDLDFKTKHYPVYVPVEFEDTEYNPKEREEAAVQFLWKLCHEGIKKRYTPERLAKVQEQYPDQDPLEVVKRRLEYEMSIIVPKGMCDYLLIVYDFINWAKRNGIPMGPGRGSGAGSIVLYLIEITDIEPLRFNLFFERFINPERISYPDIDVDICMDRREEVIKYTLQKYGSENVAQIITFGTMKAKSSIKDVGRVLSIPLTKVNAIAKLVPEDPGITLEKALELDPELSDMYSTDEDAKRIIDLGRKLEGSVRNLGIHAAGLIICGDGLTNHIPLCKSKDSEIALTQYSMKPVEMVGMLKVDFLGLKTLTCIRKAVDAVRENSGKEIDWINLPLDDSPTFDLLNQGKTLGVFQLESAGMQELARQLHLDRFEEIIAVLSLYRPGPMDMIPSFINRKHGKEEIENDHPWMQDILAETYGIMVYQEQVMQIACKLANFSLGEGDLLRRAMGKKDMAQMASMRTKFTEGSKTNNIPEDVSGAIFDKMEKFAAYGFNKSHAAAYGYLTYVTAYLKANHPKEWMAALMTCDCDDITKVGKFIRECENMGIPILSPDVNEAGKEFAAAPQGIRFAMMGIKGVGEGVVEAIINERKKGGSFASLYSFFKRIDLSKIGKKAVEQIIWAGGFDFTGWSRDAMVQSIETMYDAALQEQKDSAKGILNLFAELEKEDDSSLQKPPVVANPTSKHNLLMKEKELLGFFLTGHPMDVYKSILTRLSCVSLDKVEMMPHDAVFRCAFIVETAQVRLSAKNHKKFAILTISDGMVRMELPIWADLYEEKSQLIVENQLLYAVLQVDKREEQPKLSCRWFDDLTQVNESMVDACDQAYDKAKHQASLRQHYPKTAQNKDKEKAMNQNQNSNQSEKGSSKTETQQNTVSKTLVLNLNADSTRFTDILKLKETFRKYPGGTCVEINFITQQMQMATLYIDSQWGVTPTSELMNEIEKLAIEGLTLTS
ncbi:MAG: dnaE [Chlamydiales bacterium]|jgi:DNA polymerase-3 subunit alpha|nr:dnaE [Chlamydiales bacterium]